LKRVYRIAATALCLLTTAASAATLKVAVAANVQFVFKDIRTAFVEETGHDVEASFGSSGKLTAQILNGAPFDVFMSADMEYPEKLHAAGLALARPRTYAYGLLVLWTNRDLALDDWRSLLNGTAVSKIAIANPRTAPYGRESVRLLEHAGLLPQVKSKLVYGESIAQTNQYILSRAADVGITTSAVVRSPELKGRGSWIALPKDAYQPIAQGAVVVRRRDGDASGLATRFHDFLYSARARAIFAGYGYALP
jgi:molybdate transport system substrate-binding protein